MFRIHHEFWNGNDVEKTNPAHWRRWDSFFLCCPLRYYIQLIKTMLLLWTIQDTWFWLQLSGEGYLLCALLRFTLCLLSSPYFKSFNNAALRIQHVSFLLILDIIFRYALGTTEMKELEAKHIIYQYFSAGLAKCSAASSQLSC